MSDDGLGSAFQTNPTHARNGAFKQFTVVKAAFAFKVSIEDFYDFTPHNTHDYTFRCLPTFPKTKLLQLRLEV